MKKARKFFITLLTLLSTLTLGFAFGSCDLLGSQEPEVPTHVHAFDEWTITTLPTCTEEGERKRTCSCGEIQVEPLAATGHSIVNHQAQAPTCTEIGWEAYETCNNCDYTTYVELPSTEHKFVDGECSCGKKEQSANPIENPYEEYFVYTLNEDEKSYSVSFFTEEAYMQLKDKVSDSGIAFDTVEEMYKYAYSLVPVLQFTYPLTIPSTYNNLPVTTIPYGGFSLASFESVTVSNGITSIGEAAFSYCQNLTNITISDSVTSIGNNVFAYCQNLTSVAISDSLASIGIDVFYGCNNLQYNEYANGLYLGNETNPYLVLMESSSNNISSYSIHEDAKIIYASAFFERLDLTRIDIPASIIYIGDWAFYGCDNLEGVYIENIESWCNINFHGAHTNPLRFAKNLYLDNQLVSNLVIPNTVTHIKQYTFESCTSLTSVTIPESVASIGTSAFDGCYKLVEVYNKSSLPITTGTADYGYVGYYAKAVYTEPYTSKLSTDKNGYILYTDGDLVSLIGYIGTDTAIILPENITEINSCAFYACTSLTSVTIPESVTSIGQRAFFGCNSLAIVIFGHPNGWFTRYNNISATDLADHETAARYLKSIYCDYSWNRRV